MMRLIKSMEVIQWKVKQIETYLNQTEKKKHLDISSVSANNLDNFILYDAWFGTKTEF